MAIEHGNREVTAMHKVLMMAGVIGIGAIGFAAASQAGISLRPAQAVETSAASESVAGTYQVPNCRIEKTLKYDFNGLPYMKKVRICA